MAASLTGLWAGLYGLAHSILSLIILTAICLWALRVMFLGRK